MNTPNQTDALSPHLQVRSGMTVVWNWTDKEIEKPGLLKKEIEDIQSRGFSGVLARLGKTRYGLTDRKVIRAAAQASQWAKKRDVLFWLHADPRKASPSIIALTGEREQHLQVSRKHGGHLRPNLIRIRRNRFIMRIPYPKAGSETGGQEKDIHFEPSGLERAFLLQLSNGRAVGRTVRDITSETRFYANETRRVVEVFGEIPVPKNETWYAAAFPRFDTNQYDFAGRKSVDQLMPFIEDLFDSGLYLDGIAWNPPGRFAVPGSLPVSQSFYNSFIAEYGYDLRDRLPALALDFDDASHVEVRLHYASLLSEIFFGALKDVYGMLHAFFGDIEALIPSDCRALDDRAMDSVEFWRGIHWSGSSAAHIRLDSSSRNRCKKNLAVLAQIKSQGVFSKAQKAFALFEESGFSLEEPVWWMDLAALFSVQVILPNFRNSLGKPHGSRTAGLESGLISDLNRRYGNILRITGYKFPESDTLLVLPYETLVCSDPAKGLEIVRNTGDLIYRLIENGVQMDTVSSALLKGCQINRQGLLFRHRIYSRIIFPYPSVLSPVLLNLISTIHKTGFPIFLWGEKPHWTSEGEKIPHEFPELFDPKDEAFAQQWRNAADREYLIPENVLGSVIQTGTETLLLFCPKHPGGTVQGNACFRKKSFQISPSDRLVIYRLQGGKIKQVL